MMWDWGYEISVSVSSTLLEVKVRACKQTVVQMKYANRTAYILHECEKKFNCSTAGSNCRPSDDTVRNYETDALPTELVKPIVGTEGGRKD